jgi:hypothetical protein
MEAFLANFGGIMSLIIAFSSMWLAWYLLTPCQECGKCGSRGLVTPCCPSNKKSKNIKS